MSKPQTALHQVAAAMRWALDPAAWAADALNWTADPWQAELLRSPAKQIAVCCSRQAGKSTTTAILAAHTALFQPGALILLTSPSQRQASELLKRIHGVLSAPGVASKLVADAVTSLEMANGSRIVSLPASPDVVRGYSRPALIVEDEAAFAPDELNMALRPALAASPRGRYILLSTPAGRTGHFHSACHSPDWQQFRVTAYDCPRISKEFLDQELREHGDLYFAREFLCQFSDAEFSFFGSDLIAAAFECTAAPLRLRLFT